MREEHLAEARKWFRDYVAGFARGGGLHPALQTKLSHSERVAVEARDLARDLGWPAPQQNTAEALGLLHDLGRFSQFAEYGMFSDAASVNHGEHGWAIASRAVLLSGLERGDREAILDGIRYHNQRAIPDRISPLSLPFLKMIRDADKLDIFGIVLDAVEKDGFQALPEMLPGITLDRSCSAQVLEEIAGGSICSLQNVRSLGDFLLLQLSWVHDVNYAPTLRCLLDRDVFPRLMHHLDGDPRIQAIGSNLRRSVVQRLEMEEQAGPNGLIGSNPE